MKQYQYEIGGMLGITLIILGAMATAILWHIF